MKNLKFTPIIFSVTKELIKIILSLIVIISVTGVSFSQNFLLSLDKTTVGPLESSSQFVINCTITGNSSEKEDISFDQLIGVGAYPAPTNYTITIDDQPFLGSIVIPKYHSRMLKFTFSLPQDYNDTKFDYVFKIVFKDSYGVDQSEYQTNNITFMIDDNPPSVPSNINIHRSSSSADLSWESSSDVDDLQPEYFLKLYNEIGTLLSTSSNQTDTTYSFTNLTQCSNYSFTITAKDNFNHQSTTQQISFITTPEELPEIQLSVPGISLCSSNTTKALGQNFEVKILNYNSNLIYTYSQSSGLNCVYGGNDFRAYISTSSGPKTVTVTAINRNHSCSSTSNSKNLFISYPGKVPTPYIGSYLYPSQRVGESVKYYDHNSNCVNVADGYLWQIYKNGIKIIETPSTYEFWFYASESGSYIIKTKAYSCIYNEDSDWNEYQIYVHP